MSPRSSLQCASSFPNRLLILTHLQCPFHLRLSFVTSSPTAPSPHTGSPGQTQRTQIVSPIEWARFHLPLFPPPQHLCMFCPIIVLFDLFDLISRHSSSSAIFERDIEPIAPSPPATSHTQNPHRIPRGKATEQLEYSVPSVLDSAATVLASPDDSISVLAPAIPSPELSANSRSGLASPSSRLSSRSPSPAAARSNKLPSPSPSASVPLPPLRPPIQAQQSTASSIGPVPGAYLPTPTTTSPPLLESEQHPAAEPSTPTTVPTQSASQSGTAAISPHPPSPRSNRLSFISYADLLTSTPASAVPLASLTTAATVADPPPHLPSVLGLPQQHASSGSVNASTRSSWYFNERDIREGREGLFVDEAGGEWEREGLGQGLEERLESLMGMNQVGQVTSKAT
jgi:hypothetical protein